MSGRFDGLTDTQWRLLEPLLPKDPLKRGKGKPHTPWRNNCLPTQKNGDGKLKEVYLGCNGSLEGLLSDGKEKSSTGRAF